MRGVTLLLCFAAAAAALRLPAPLPRSNRASSTQPPPPLPALLSSEQLLGRRATKVSVIATLGFSLPASLPAHAGQQTIHAWHALDFTRGMHYQTLSRLI